MKTQYKRKASPLFNLSAKQKMAQEDYGLPATRIRSDLEAFLDDGRDEKEILKACFQLESHNRFGKPTHPIGDIYRVILQCAYEGRMPYRIRVLKLGEGNYRYGHTVEELEHLAMLHGVYRGD